MLLSYYDGVGFMYNGGTFDANNGTVEINARDLTPMTLQAPITFNNFIVNMRDTYNAGTLVFDNTGNTVTVDGTLTLADGRISEK
jgi:hypothetical protein